MAEFKKAFVTGWPIEHSRSPLIHNYWLELHELAGSYVKHACPPEAIANFLSGLKESEFIGGNVTIPHKEAVCRLVDVLHLDAEILGAANTVWLADGKLHATNTDGYGFLANLDDRSPGWDSGECRKRGALVLGAGGAARPIVHALVERGFTSVFIANRTFSRAEALADRFGSACQAVDPANLPDAVRRCGLVVNTTSVGMNDNGSPIDLAGFEDDTIVNDIVYTPLLTPLLKQAGSLGMQPVDGLGMLLHQAVPGFERWFGVRPNVTPDLRALLLADLGENQ